MSIDNRGNEGKKVDFTASMRPKLRNLNTITYEDYYDFERKRSGSDEKRKKKKYEKVFDDIDLR